ncbi:uncharacterized protein LOC131051268 [Cryptomeria japonica]|uniref:uncharacterized protein LOC131051268 n=1 Tax=Cryptomeria japonica TaxID=3369 RepID=UPI0027DA0D01|nr:uncharacterized protein LOC131051268 [Cryptomeria japonica]
MGIKPQWDIFMRPCIGPRSLSKITTRGIISNLIPFGKLLIGSGTISYTNPIHAAGYFLNPRFRFGGSYSDSNGEVMEGLSTCIERMVPNVEERDLIVSELQNYQGGRGKLFSSELARRGRTTQTPDAWWQNWGGNTPHLKQFALRVLCQPCSSSNCERNWSLFEAIHTKKRSKLEQK